MISARTDGHQQRHGNVMTSVRIVVCLQDTAGVHEPHHGEMFCWREWNARKTNGACRVCIFMVVESYYLSMQEVCIDCYAT